jgi:hypothetical protein
MGTAILLRLPIAKNPNRYAAIGERLAVHPDLVLPVAGFGYVGARRAQSTAKVEFVDCQHPLKRLEQAVGLEGTTRIKPRRQGPLPMVGLAGSVAENEKSECARATSAQMPLCTCGRTIPVHRAMASLDRRPSAQSHRRPDTLLSHVLGPRPYRRSYQIA